MLSALFTGTRYFYNSMYSVDSNYEDKLAAIKSELSERFAVAKSRNEKNVMEMMTSVKLEILEKFVDKFKGLALPIPKSYLRQHGSLLFDKPLSLSANNRNCSVRMDRGTTRAV